MQLKTLCTKISELPKGCGIIRSLTAALKIHIFYFFQMTEWVQLFGSKNDR